VNIQVAMNNQEQGLIEWRKKSRQTFQKREKEKARVQKRNDKEARRLESKALRANIAPVIEDEDPDIAGIRPGPHPLPEQWNYVSDGGVDFNGKQ
jgi:hypothetical protein